jgi:CRISPR-associated protein Csc1
MAMAQSIKFTDLGIRLYHGRLYNHDYLWFSSNEISKVSTTQPFLHNYALCYALAQRSYRACVGSIPKYIQDPEGEFGAMPLYATPAHAMETHHTAVTFNAVDSCTLTTGDSKTINSPNLGKRIYLDLTWEPLNIERPMKGFELYVFVFADYRLPSVFRLGKKGAVIRAQWEEISNPLALFRTTPQTPAHVINPLDISGRLISYDPILIPPHMLLRTATLSDDWFVYSGRRVIHVPKRILERAGAVA